MLIKIALLLSVLLQFVAFVMTISLTKRTKFIVAWITISIGFFLMALRRLSELIALFQDDFGNTHTLFDNWIAVLISILMFVASFYIRQIFNLQSRINKLRKENESRVLSAIINTEEKDRQLFAKELHDGIGPILSTIKMAISAINISTIGKKDGEIIAKTETAVDNAIETVKEISNNLSPHILENFGLLKAIRTFVNSLVVVDKPEISIETNLEQKKLPYNTELVLYRIVCELLTNTLKHAHATIVSIAITIHKNELQFIYKDDGVGFDGDTVSFNGMGLSNIRSRVKSLGGSLELLSKEHEGFTLTIQLPV